MLKKSITYTNFNDEEVTEDFYFHLSKAELVEMEMGKPGGLEKYLRRIIESEDGAAIMDEFKKLILKAYGRKSHDGTRFVKNDDLREEFLSSEAYSALFMELVTDAGAAAAFVNGIVPQNIKEDFAAMGMPERTHPSDTAAEPAPPAEPAAPENVFDANNPKILTPAEVLEIDGDELKSGIATGKYKLQP